MKPGQLVRTDGFEWMPVLEGPACLDFGDDQDVAVERHDVDFTLGTTPVAVHDPHALGFEVNGREFLPAPAKHVLSFHRTSVRRGKGVGTGVQDAMWKPQSGPAG